MPEQPNVGADALSLPKGGGSLRGLGESFEPNLFTGTGNLTVPLQLSPGRQGFTPPLTLQYSTGGPNGPFGLGWSLSSASVRRKTEAGVPRYDGSDTFVLSGADDLVERDDRPVRDEGDFSVTSYRPRVEGLFARIERWVRVRGAVDPAFCDEFWRVSTRDGSTHLYGRTPGAVAFHAAAPERRAEWRLELSWDPRGNYVHYAYKREDGAGVPGSIDERLRDGTQLYLKSVRYGNVKPLDPAAPEAVLVPAPPGEAFLYEVLLDYGEHGLRDGDAQVVNAGIAAEVRPWLVRPDPFSSGRVGFEQRTYRRCARIVMLHHRVPGELGPVPVRTHDLAYEEAPWTRRSQLVQVVVTGYRRASAPGRRRSPLAEAGQGGVVSDDFEVAALPPLRLEYTRFEPGAQAFRAIEARGGDLPPAGLGEPGMALADLSGTGLQDVVELSGDRARYWRNLGFGLLDRPRPFPVTPAASLEDEGVSFGDVTGNGRADLLVHGGPLWGFHALEGEGGWSRFTPYEARPSFALSDPRVRLVDLTGDGKTDALRADAGELVLFPCLGARGFGPPVRLPRLHALDDFPDVDFASDRVFLADLNGDGLKDVVLVHQGRIDYWPSLGWGRFGRRVTMAHAPQLPSGFDPRRLVFADLTGAGPEDLVYVDAGEVRFWLNQSGNGWSDEGRIGGTPLVTPEDVFRAVDFLGTGCAGLLFSGPRRLGQESNYGFLDFTGGAKPYVLRASRSSMGSETTVELVPSTQFLADELRAGRRWTGTLPFPVQVVARVRTVDRLTGAERVSAFRYRHGIWDGARRTFAGFACVEARDAEAPGGSGGAAAPPLLTRSWYHPGVPEDAGFSLAHALAERWTGDPAASPPAAQVDPADSPADAAAALRGALLRVERYALDGTAEAANPLSVVASGFRVRCLQRRGARAGGVFHASALESLTWNYERDPADPRIAQQLVVAIDAHGLPTRTVHVAYARRVPRFPEQGAMIASCDRLRYAHLDGPSGPYRLGMLVEEEKLELALPALSAHVTLADVAGWDLEGGPHRRFSHRRHYYDGPPGDGLPLGQVGARGLLSRSESLALAPGDRAALFGPRADAAALAAAGYVESPAGGDAWWRQDGRTVYGGLFLQPVRAFDPLGNATETQYDPTERFPVTITDAVGLRTEAIHDPWTLAPTRTIDANGNESRVRFDPLGLVVATIEGGKPGQAEGDTEASPTTSMAYDLYAYWRSEQAAGPLAPVWARTLQRTAHVSDDPAAPLQESVTYHDGAGRELQVKHRAEPDPADPAAAPRWAASGWQVRDHKGQVVEDWEPAFTSSDAFEPDLRRGAPLRTAYDALGRAVRKDAPDGTFTRVVFGAWSQTTHDANDTSAGSDWAVRLSQGDAYERDAVTKALAHAGTPTVLHLDPLARSFLSVEDGGPGVGQLETRTRFDIQGDPLELVDPAGVVVCRSRYDLLKHVAVRRHVDSGERMLLVDAAGDPLRRWDARGDLFEHRYDAGRRLLETWVTGAGGARRLIEATTYGEGQPQAAARNLRGQVFERRDTAGRVRFLRYDLHGQATESEQSLLADPEAAVDWSAGAPVFTADSPHRVQQRHDALGRLTSAVLPDGSRLAHRYNLAGLPERVEVAAGPAGAATPVVTAAEYDARGRRTRARYGHGLVTTHAYDPSSRRLARVTSTLGNATVQTLAFAYDAAGNLTSTRDDAREVQFFGNAQVSADRFFAYDAAYRLVEASGREHAVAPAAQEDATFEARYADRDRTDLRAVRRYTEKYRYDRAGNVLSIGHAAPGSSWTRTLSYQPGSNRLATLTSGRLLPQLAFAHDPHGNLSALPSAPALGWDERDRLVAADLAGGGRALYQHDGAGRRVRKVVRFANGFVREFVYLGHLEYEREYATWADFQAGVARLRLTRLHVMDGGRRACIVDRLEVAAGAPVAGAAELRYQLHAEAGSSTIEVSAAGEVLSMEEYYPLGGSAFAAYLDSARLRDKRYRFSGQELDAETGLYAMGARRYAPWLGRWTGCDPAGEAGGLNPYVYAGNRFVVRSDTTGRYDPAAFGDQLAGYVDVAEGFYLMEDRNLGTSLWNTAVSTIATVARGSTSIFKVGTGAAQGVEQLRNAQDGWDYAIGTARILSDAGEVASSSLGFAGTTTKVVQTAKVMKIEKQLQVVQTQRASAKGHQARQLSEQIGELQTEKLATQAGLADQGPMNIMSKKGTPTRNGVDKAYSGAKPFSKEKNVVVEAKARAQLPDEPTDMLGSARGNVQGSEAYNLERLTTAATSGNGNAAQVLNKINTAGSHDSFLVATEVSVGAQPHAFQLTGAGGATPTATLASGLPDVNPHTTIAATAAATTVAQSLQQQR